MRKSVRKARARIVRAEAKLARLDRRQESRQREVARELDEARLLALNPSLAADNAALSERIWPHRRALLIINSKSGPKRDSLLRTREIVDTMGLFNFQTEVRVKLRKSQARKEARLAAKRKFDVVIAAGGDGTVEAVARGLVDTSTPLGILPLGTYNNVAACLGVPTDLASACALIANFDPRPIDVGMVQATGMSKPRMFLEMATVGLGAIFAPIGQDLQKGRLSEAARTLPLAMNMSPSGMTLRLDGADESIWGNSLLLTVNNAPRSGAALNLAPEARMDDALLDITMYDGIAQVELAARVLALKNGVPITDRRARRVRAISVAVDTLQVMAVAADSKLVGVTPARFSVRAGALQALVGRGPGLSRPATGAVPLPLAGTPTEQPAVPSLPDLATPVGTWRPSLPSRMPSLTRTATPLLVALAGAVAVPLVKALVGRHDRKR